MKVLVKVVTALRPMRRIVLACALLVAAAGCARAPAGAPASTTSAPRLVSLAPSLTEIAYALGCGPSLVGDTRYDDYPPQARTLPHVADLSHVDLELLARLRPTKLLALHDEEKEGGEASRALGVDAVYLQNRGLDDLYIDISGVGAACGRAPQAARLASTIRSRLGAIHADALRRRGASRAPRVLFLLGLPGFTAGRGSYLDDVITVAGGSNVAGDVDQPYPDLSTESIAAFDPDVIVVSRDVPFGADVRAREPWRSLRAVRAGRVETPPDDDILERPGPRIVEGASWLAQAIR